MRRYAVSVGAAAVCDVGFERAMDKAEVRSIEFSESLLPPAGTARKWAGRLKELSGGAGLKIAGLHLPFGPFEELPFLSEAPEARRLAVTRSINYLEMFRDLGIRNITIHCGGEPNPPETRRERLLRMTECLGEFQSVLEAMDASLNLELLPRSCLGNHEDELLAMLAELPADHYNICLDVNHLMNRFREVPSVIRKCAPRLRTFHLSDHDGIDENHWPVGSGILNWPEIRKAAGEIAHDLLMIVEIAKPVPWDAHGVDPEFVLRAGAESALRFEYAAEWEQLRTAFGGIA